MPRRHIDALIEEYRQESREVPVEDMRYWNGLTEGLRIARRSILGDDRGRLYLAPDHGGDLCLWRDDRDRPGWPQHLAWQGGVDPAVWAILAAVIPVRSEG